MIETLTGALSTAIKRELDSRRVYLDSARDIAEVHVTLKLQAGTTWVRGVVWQEERRSRQTMRNITT